MRIYFGKRQIKTISEVAAVTGYSAKRVAEIAHPIAREKLFEQCRVKIKGRIHTAYKKIGFVASNKSKILRLAGNSQGRKNYHNKSNPRGFVIKQRIVVKTPYKVKSEFFQAEDVKEFARMKKTHLFKKNLPRSSEASLKAGIGKLLGETHMPKDWGGENNDIFTAKLTIAGAKRIAAFALKGPAKKGSLVPRMMGKNGDQIQRLFNSPAEVFIIQYEGPVSESVYELMTELAKARAVSGGHIRWTVIDYEGTQKLRRAYPRIFKIR